MRSAPSRSADTPPWENQLLTTILTCKVVLGAAVAIIPTAGEAEVGAATVPSKGETETVVEVKLQEIADD